MKEPYFLIRLRAFRYAIRGLKYFFREAHARLHLLAAVLVCVLGSWLQIESWEWVAVLLCIAMVMGAEALNSALEHLTDIISPHWNERAGLVKDMAAAAVLLLSIFAAIVGLIIFIPKILILLSP